MISKSSADDKQQPSPLYSSNCCKFYQCKAELNDSMYLVKEYITENRTNYLRGLNELSILKRIEDGSKNIIHLEKHSIKQDRLRLFFPYEKEGDLISFIERRGSNKLSQSEIKEILKGVFNGIKDLHSRDIIHCDLKLENIVITYDKNTLEIIPKIIDFNSAVVLSNDDIDYVHIENERFITPEFAPPEVLVNDMRPDKSYDIWSLGIIVYLLVYNSFPPFTSRDNTKNSRILKSVLVNENKLINDLIKGLLEFQKENRMNIEQALLHPYFSEILGKTSLISLKNSDFIKTIQIKRRRCYYECLKKSKNIIKLYFASHYTNKLIHSFKLSLKFQKKSAESIANLIHEPTPLNSQPLIFSFLCSPKETNNIDISNAVEDNYSSVFEIQPSEAINLYSKIPDSLIKFNENFQSCNTTNDSNDNKLYVQIQFKVKVILIVKFPEKLTEILKNKDVLFSIFKGEVNSFENSEISNKYKVFSTMFEENLSTLYQKPLYLLISDKTTQYSVPDKIKCKTLWFNEEIMEKLIIMHSVNDKISDNNNCIWNASIKIKIKVNSDTLLRKWQVRAI